MMAEAWFSLLTLVTVDPIAIAAFLAFLVVMAIIHTWPWGWDEDHTEEKDRP